MADTRPQQRNRATAATVEVRRIRRRCCKKEFKPKTDRAQARRSRRAVHTLAEQALAEHRRSISSDVVKTIEAIIAALDRS